VSRSQPGLSSAVPIAIVLRALEPGGTESQMLELVRRLDPARWAVHVACLRADGAWHARAASHAASVVEFPVRSFRSPRAVVEVARFARWCHRARIAVVHAATLSGNLFGLAGAALAGVPVRIGSQRGYDFDRSRVERHLQRLAYARAHRVVANTAALAAWLAASGVPRERVVVVPNGVERSTGAGRPVGEIRRVVMVGTLRAVKGHDVLIDAAPRLLARHPGMRFDIVGGGPLAAELRARAASLGVAPAFTFHGHREDARAWAADADVVVLPSRSEGLPNAILEAMAAGRPVVASAVGGIPDAIEHGVTGLLVPPGDPLALADALARLAADPLAAGRMGQAAREAASSRFSFDRMVDAHDRLYAAELALRGHDVPVGSLEAARR
jgi:glycosyltransferase involved in cell wall biosynthesis